MALRTLKISTLSRKPLLAAHGSLNSVYRRFHILSFECYKFFRGRTANIARKYYWTTAGTDSSIKVMCFTTRVFTVHMALINLAKIQHKTDLVKYVLDTTVGFKFADKYRVSQG